MSRGSARGGFVLTLVLSLVLTQALAVARVTRAHAQWTEPVRVAHAAFETPSDVPSAIVHAGSAFDPKRPLHLVVYLHGYMACAAMLLGEGAVRCKASEPPLEGRGLARAHDQAGLSTLLIVPQLAFVQRSGKAGCFKRPGCFRAFLEETLAALPATRIGGKKSLTQVERITLLAHSAGYEAALAVLEHGEVSALVQDIVLFDALYGGQHEYLAWIAHNAHARLWSLHLRGGRPAKNSAILLRSAQRTLGSARVEKLDGELRGGELAGQRVATVRLAGGHREMPTRYLTAVLRALASK